MAEKKYKVTLTADEKNCVLGEGERPNPKG
jgi:hypothetical protein